VQLTLSSPEITCAHCIATIQKTVDGIDGARFISGDWETRRFAIEVASGSLLDAVTGALEAEGYPLGEADVPAGGAGPVEDAHDWQPLYRVTSTSVGADVNYACPCSCDAGFALDRSKAEQSPEHCCCGRTILVGNDAEERLRSALAEPETYAFDVQTVTMPWGQPVQAALAIPITGAEHGAHAEH